MPYVDVCFGNTYDINNLGIKEETKEQTIERFLKTYNVSYLLNTDRTIIDALTQSLRANVYYLVNNNITTLSTEPERFEVLDRIGGGDAFVAGIIHILNRDFSNLKDALELGLKCDILKHLVRGDVLSLSKNEIEEFANKGKDVIR